MENVLTPVKKNIPTQKEASSSDFVPVKAFFSKLQERETPYNGKFSIRPFLEKRQASIPSCEHGNDTMMRSMLNKVEEGIGSVSDELELVKTGDTMEILSSIMFPSLFFEGQLGFIGVPFSKNFIYKTPALTTFTESKDIEIRLPDFMKRGDFEKPSIDIADMILKTFYNFKHEFLHKEILTFRDKKTGLERHFKIQLIQDYVKGKALKPLKKLSQKQIHDLLNNYDNTELWLKLLPPENFEFEGMVVGFLQDVTDVESLSKIKHLLADESEKSDHINQLTKIEHATRSYLKMPEIKIGMVHTAKSHWQSSTSWNLLRHFDKETICDSFDDKKGAYGKVILKNEVVVIPDLSKKSYLSKLEQTLLDRGEKSLLLAPLHNPEGNVIGVFEMASSLPYRFNRLTFLEMNDIIELFALGTLKFIEQLENSTRLTIQNLFTAIHPSVDWRFREVAAQHFWSNAIENKISQVEPIVFKHVHPLYAQADIVGSSKLRNQSIEADLKDNLRRAMSLISACREKLNFHLLDMYCEIAKKELSRLERGEFVSNDESHIIDLLKKQFHPLLHELSENYPQLPQDEIKAYFEYLDPNLGIVYRHRKAYEDSVSQLNDSIAEFIEKEDQKMQKILPHFFEKYVTDGVEYNLYLGQSLLEKKQFSSFYLQDFRLWQLIKMCEVTRLVRNLENELPVPLTTAQLIFVFNSTMSIRFNMEEKQFDVDGTYNVRYEILKKRIDKAVIRGTKERLTQAGKVAIVWLHEKDRREYWGYLEHLINQGLIKDEIEDLALEKMQGVEGLRALRVEVT